jgi:signal transduction histidine kinase
MKRSWEKYLNSLTLVERNTKEFEFLKKLLFNYSILVSACGVAANVFFFFKDPLNYFAHNFPFWFTISSIGIVVPILIHKNKYSAATFVFIFAVFIENILEVYIHGVFILGFCDMCLFGLFIAFFFPTIPGSVIGLFLNFATMIILGIIQAYRFNDNNVYILTYEEYFSQFINITMRILVVSLLNSIDGFKKHRRLKELKEMNIEMKKLAKSKSRFFATVSHELRNPLNALLGSIELLGLSDTSHFDMEILSTAKICGETLLNLIGNVLDVMKIENNKLELYESEADLRDMFDKSFRMSKIIGKNKELFVKLSISESLPDFLFCDVQKLMQVIVNITSNALKFTSKGGIFIKVDWYPKEPIFREEQISDVLEEGEMERILETVNEINPEFEENGPNVLNKYLTPDHFSASRKKRRSSFSPEDKNRLSIDKEPSLRRNSQSQESNGILKIQIIDTGIGISEEHINKLFQPFVQAEASTSGTYGGTGLGLWISKKIINLMKGDIRIQSKLK